MAIRIPEKKQSPNLLQPLLSLAGMGVGAAFGGAGGAALGGGVGSTVGGLAAGTQSASAQPAPIGSQQQQMAAQNQSAIQRKIESSQDNTYAILNEGFRSLKHLPQEQQQEYAPSIALAMQYRRQGLV